MLVIQNAFKDDFLDLIMVCHHVVIVQADELVIFGVMHHIIVLLVLPIDLLKITLELLLVRVVAVKLCRLRLVLHMKIVLRHSAYIEQRNQVVTLRILLAHHLRQFLRPIHGQITPPLVQLALQQLNGLLRHRVLRVHFALVEHP